MRKRYDFDEVAAGVETAAEAVTIRHFARRLRQMAAEARRRSAKALAREDARQMAEYRRDKAIRREWFADDATPAARMAATR